MSLKNLLDPDKDYKFYEKYYDYRNDVWTERPVPESDLANDDSLVNVTVKAGDSEAIVSGQGGFATLADAMARAQELGSATVTLLRDTAAADVTVSQGNITLQGNGYTVGGGLTLSGGSLAVNGAGLGNVTVSGEGSLTVSGGEVKSLTVRAVRRPYPPRSPP